MSSSSSSKLILRSFAGSFLTAAALGLASTGSALAEQTTVSKTRDQVMAELAEARRTGDIVDAKSGKKLNELYPNSYPPKVMASGLTREQVLAELAEAKQTGDIVDAKSGKKLNELYPSNYPPKVMSPGLTREQVQAELMEAKRTGDIVDTKSGKKLNELFPSEYQKGS